MEKRLAPCTFGLMNFYNVHILLLSIGIKKNSQQHEGSFYEQNRNRVLKSLVQGNSSGAES